MVDKKYDIAISFAGEDRDIAEVIAWTLKPSGTKVFYDEDSLHELWGKNLSEELEEIYSKSAKYCLMIISKSYLEKMWPRHERRSALSRHIKEGTDYILPYIVDDTSIDDVPGLYSDMAYIRRSEKNLLDVSTVILNKLYPGQDYSLEPSKLRHLVDACDFILSYLQNISIENDSYLKMIIDEHQLYARSTERYDVRYYFHLGSKMLKESNIINILPGQFLGPYFSFTDHGANWSRGLTAGERKRIIAGWVMGDCWIG